MRCIGAEGGGWFGRTTVARLVEREREGAVRLQLLTEQCSVVRLSASLPGLVEGHVWKNGPRKANWVKWPRDVELGQKIRKMKEANIPLLGNESPQSQNIVETSRINLGTKYLGRF